MRRVRGPWGVCDAHSDCVCDARCDPVFLSDSDFSVIRFPRAVFPLNRSFLSSDSPAVFTLTAFSLSDSPRWLSSLFSGLFSFHVSTPAECHQELPSHVGSQLPLLSANRDVSSELTQSGLTQVFMAGYVSSMKNGFVFCMPFLFFFLTAPHFTLNAHWYSFSHWQLFFSLIL